ncbi:Tol-Pal system beta propeller repeat protein TolB [Marinobacterium weihaiense]|uniref:Tol-Pal system protein TolB n=1 Tax=Marinobacterium weihaiense TaxID=2851016 RepID=A0ABS6M7E6_9GAMM|nr:Tol-Pal system beta propeller repeat protein TolB [Marinobacterium weihaiense]MBV0932203.1 Tol-Pal system beta propeller repeat protein TolB [Marinobacterium weihaiense]
MLMVLVVSVARAELVVEVTQGVEAPTSVAVVPFGNDTGQALPEDVAAIVQQDLGRSGFFQPMLRDNMLGFPTRSEDIFFRDWRLAKMDYVIIGRARAQDDGQIRIEFELHDVLREQAMLSEQVTTARDNLRDAAHLVADRLFERLTGLKGAFSTRIVYVTAEQLGPKRQRFRLQMADWDGARARTILESSEPILSPVWSMDGSKLAYVSFETGKPSIYVQYLASGRRERIQSFPGLNGAPAWSPDGNQLALVLSRDGNPEVYVLDLRSRQLQRITRHYGIDTEPSWSPDGRSLIFTSDRGGQPQIYQLDLASRDLKRLTFQGNYNARGRLTQDGRFLAMVHRSGGGGNGFDIAVQDLKTDRVDVLTQSAMAESPSIAPNGSVVIYATQEGTKGVLAAVSLDGRVQFRMPAVSGDVREPAWSPYLR